MTRLKNMLSALQINGNIEQLNLGDGTINHYGSAAEDREASAAQKDDDAFMQSLRNVIADIRGKRVFKYAHLYFYLVREQQWPLMNAKQFGERIEDLSGVSAETVRKSGDYTRTTPADEAAIKAIAAYF